MDKFIWGVIGFLIGDVIMGTVFVIMIHLAVNPSSFHDGIRSAEACIPGKFVQKLEDNKILCEKDGKNWIAGNK